VILRMIAKISMVITNTIFIDGGTLTDA